MSVDHNRPILVTGSHRSGTTWVGRMLAAADNVQYIHEPFNPNHSPGICRATFPLWFQYITADNEAPFRPALTDTLELHYALAKQITGIRHPRDFFEAIAGPIRFSTARLRKKRPLLKDPIAIFSAEWLATTFNMEVVVLIRHPAAFVSSLVKLGWEHPFDHFLRQPLLMERFLAPYQEPIEKFASHPQPIVDQGILLWNLIHHVIANYKEHHHDWCFVRHEELSRGPIAHFRSLYDALGLKFTPTVARTLDAHSKSSNPSDPPGRDAIRRNSLANLSNWKKRLSRDDISRIREGTYEVVRHFYDDDDWG